MSYVTHADVGGRAERGRIASEPGDEPFHAAWEARAMALTVAMGATGAWNLDISRSARETLPDYARLDYYSIWIAALERLLERRGLASADEIATGRMQRPAAPVARVLRAADVGAALANGSPTARAPTAPARFAVGDRVRARTERPDHHTRLPAYVRGHAGTVARCHGVHVFADAHAFGLGEMPRWLYTVVFDAAELWPANRLSADAVSIDAWEPYLEPA